VSCVNTITNPLKCSEPWRRLNIEDCCRLRLLLAWGLLVALRSQNCFYSHTLNEVYVQPFIEYLILLIEGPTAVIIKQMDRNDLRDNRRMNHHLQYFTEYKLTSQISPIVGYSFKIIP